MTTPTAHDSADGRLFPQMWTSRAAQRRAAFLTKARLKAWIAADFASLGVWTPVAIGAGVGVYFGLKSEPPFALSLSLVLGAFAASMVLSKFQLAGRAVALAALGFLAADLRTARVEAPVLDRDLGIRVVEGRVVSVEMGARGQRFVIELASIDRLEKEKTPRRARITWRGEAASVGAGDQVTLRAGLGPPPPPAAPGGFDFARQLYFQKIGAVGFAVSPPMADPTISGRTIRARIENLRAGLASRITIAAPGQGGAIVAAVVTGKRDAITNESRAALRDAGLAHLLAISGLHMGLATGIIFFAVRGGLAAIRPLAVRYPIKKWAALAALLSGFSYLLLSGGAWSPRRAFIMTAIILAAILFDRRALSLRNVAIAASLILLTTPEALVHPGFQMSFAAAAALISLFEWWSRAANPSRDFSPVSRFRRYVIGIGLTDLVASVATAPFALYHFNRVAVYSLPANMLAMPLMAFWIMPAAVIGLLLTPLGLDGYAWKIAAAGVDAVLTIGATVSSWPASIRLTPQWPTMALIVISLCGLWFVLARSPLRLAGLAGPPLVWLMVSASPPADLFVAASGQNVGIVLEENGKPRILAYSGRRDKFSVRVWSEIIGAEETERSVISKAELCGGDGCVVTINDRRISVIERRAALAEDCVRADLVVAMFPVSGADWRACNAVLIDKRSIWKRGAHAVWLSESDIRIRTVAEARGERPWTGAN